MKRIVYTADRNPTPEDGVEFRNARFFQAPLGDPSLVEVRGDFPAILAAYGIEPSAKDEAKEETKPKKRGRPKKAD